MVVDYFQNLCLVYCSHGLGELVVVDQNDLFILAVHDVVAGSAAHDPVILIDDGIGVITCSHHLDTDILSQLVGIELDDLGRHDLADGRSEISVSGSVHGAVTGNDHGDAVFPGQFQYFLTHLIRTHQDQHTCAHLDHVFLGVYVVTDDNDLVLDFVDGDIFLGDGDNRYSSADVAVRRTVNDLSVNRGIDVLGRDILEKFLGTGSIAHGNQADIVHGNHADDFVVFINNAAGLLVSPMHQLDRLKDGFVRHDRGRIVNLDFGHLDTGILKQHGLLEPESVEKVSGLGSDFSKSAGNGLHAIGTLEKSVADRGSDRVCIRVLMSSNIDHILCHIFSPFSIFGASPHILSAC